MNPSIAGAIRPAVALIVLFTALCGVVLPLAATAIATAIVPNLANGSLVRVGGHVIGSTLIGQNFTAAGDFQDRPSATTNTDSAGKTVPRPYDASSSGASNLAPTSKALVDRVRAAVKAAPGGPGVPADMVTTSASGLDPDISPADALRQVPRVAAARHLPDATVRDLVLAHVQGRSIGVFGEPRVNVLLLNLALKAAH